jgi:hypothetical protein
MRALQEVPRHRMPGGSEGLAALLRTNDATVLRSEFMIPMPVPYEIAVVQGPDGNERRFRLAAILEDHLAFDEVVAH